MAKTLTEPLPQPTNPAEIAGNGWDSDTRTTGPTHPTVAPSWWASTAQLAQAPTQDYHSYTHTLLGVVEEHVVGPSDPPVKKTRQHSAAKQLWPNRGRHNAFPLLGLGGKRCSFCVHGADVEEVGLPALPQAEGSYL